MVQLLLLVNRNEKLTMKWSNLSRIQSLNNDLHAKLQTIE